MSTVLTGICAACASSVIAGLQALSYLDRISMIALWLMSAVSLRKIWLPVLAALALTPHAHAYVDTKGLIAMCGSKQEDSAGSCIGYIQGVADTLVWMICTWGERSSAVEGSGVLALSDHSKPGSRSGAILSKGSVPMRLSWFSIAWRSDGSGGACSKALA